MATTPEHVHELLLAHTVPPPCVAQADSTPSAKLIKARPHHAHATRGKLRRLPSVQHRALAQYS